MSTFVDRHRWDFDWTTLGGNGSFADILWRDHAGDDVLWLMVGNSRVDFATLPTVTPDWHVKAAAEFDDDNSFGNADILWQNDNGALALWQMNGKTVSAIHALPNPGPTWHVAGDNDFDGVSGDEILFQNDNGSLAMWTRISAGTGAAPVVYTGTQNPGPSWHVVGTGDTNNNEVAGILWQNDNGALVLWEDPTFSQAALTFTFNTLGVFPTVDSSWHVKGMQDINGDRRADVVFQNDNGAVVVWEMGGTGGTTITSVNLVNLNPGSAWHVVGLRDMNNDQKIDILFQHDNGAAAVWLDYQPLGGGLATFQPFGIIPNPNPNRHVWDLV